MAAKNKTVVVIAGPTAVGKTAVAVQVAQHFGTEIISADSRQCYRELNIGVARPSAEELAAVPHHFVATHSIHEKVNATTFEQYALLKTKELFQQHDVVVVAGGTGLYIKAFLEGVDAIPDVPESVRNEIVENYFAYGLNWLQQQVQQHDPEFYAVGEIHNPQRLMRALEVVKATGTSILHFRTGTKKERDFAVIKTTLTVPREQLHHNINNRIETMMEIGLLEEVQRLFPYRQLHVLQTVGYQELFAYLSDEITLAEAVARIKQNTRQYAKRQQTWSRKDKEYTWLPPDAKAVFAFLNNNIG